MVRVWRFVFCVAGRLTPGSKPPHEPGSRLTRSVRRACLAVTVTVLTTLVPPPSAAQSPALFTAVNEIPPPGPLGTLTLVVNGETVVGTVRTLGETYHIRSVGDGLYAISEVEEPPLNCGVEGPHSETDHPH